MVRSVADRAFLPAKNLFEQVGDMMILTGKTIVSTIRPPYPYGGEFMSQFLFALRLCWFPLLISTIAFGYGAPGVQAANFLTLFGAIDRLGGFFVLASIREFAPFVDAIIVAGVAGTAITADLGARKIREELDALQVLGVDPVKNLVVPRFLALMLVTGSIWGRPTWGVWWVWDARLTLSALLLAILLGYLALRRVPAQAARGGPGHGEVLPSSWDPSGRGGGRGLGFSGTCRVLIGGVPFLRQRRRGRGAGHQLAAFCKAQGMTDIFVQLPYAAAREQGSWRIRWDPHALRPLLRALHGAGVRVDALDGHPRYVLTENHDMLVATIRAVGAYHRSAPPAERFSGIRYDNEPYLLRVLAGIHQE
jgi:hypothetical protein